MSPDKTFYRVLGLVVCCMIVGILVLSLLVTTSGPRVRHVIVQNSSEAGSKVPSVDQGLTVVFDRPIKGADFESAVEVRPRAEYTVSHRQGQLNITFGENLLSSTGYALTVGPALEDDAGKRMKGEYEYEFVTEEPTFTYLERGYGPGAMDQIVERAPLSGEDQTLFEAPQIEYFARTDDHLAVVLPHGDDVADELRVIDLRNGDQEAVGVPGNVKIDAPTPSPVGGQFAFVTRANIGRGADEVYRRGYDGRLYRYDIDGEGLLPVDTLSEKGNVESVSYSRDGQALLYRTTGDTTGDGTYYLTGAAGGEAGSGPIPLGRYDDSGGFDRASAGILFRNDDVIAIYDARTKRLRELPHADTGGTSSTPMFLHNSDALVYLEKLPDPDTGETTSRVSIVDETGGTEARVDPPPRAYFFDDPVVSYDDRYLLIESAPASGAFDSYASNPQPQGSRLLLYDRSARRMIDEVRGLDPVWNR